jgi:hypothetical protein
VQVYRGALELRWQRRLTFWEDLVASLLGLLKSRPRWHCYTVSNATVTLKYGPPDWQDITGTIAHFSVPVVDFLNGDLDVAGEVHATNPLVTGDPSAIQTVTYQVSQLTLHMTYP